MNKFLKGMLMAGLVMGFSALASAEPINDKCPMAGRDVDASKTTTVEIKFCCGNCKGKFDKNPGEYLEKASKAKPGTCPVGGRAANDSQVSTVTVAFCCGNCKGNFDKDPIKNLAKVKPAKK